MMKVYSHLFTINTERFSVVRNVKTIIISQMSIQIKSSQKTKVKSQSQKSSHVKPSQKSS